MNAGNLLPEEHDPLCSLGQQAGDQTMPCDCDGAPVRSPEHLHAIRELIEQWREDAKESASPPGYDEFIYNSAKCECADQLEAALIRLSGESVRCSGCGARWTSPEGFLLAGVVHLCGDCWRKVQPVLHPPEWPPRPCEPPKDDVVCEHGTAMDVHCCNCHSGFIFDMDHQCPPDGEVR